MKSTGGGHHGRHGSKGGDTADLRDAAAPRDAAHRGGPGAPPCHCGLSLLATEVPSGHVQAAGHGVLRVSALGSCVAVVAWDRRTGRGGIAHIMLPGSAPQGRAGNEKTRYCEDGIEALLAALSLAPGVETGRGAHSSPAPSGRGDESGSGSEPQGHGGGAEPAQEVTSVRACLVGAGNVLCRADGSLCHANFQSVTQALWRRGISVLACHVGGTERRSVTFDVDKGCVYFTKSSSTPKLLCRFLRS